MTAAASELAADPGLVAAAARNLAHVTEEQASASRWRPTTKNPDDPDGVPTAVTAEVRDGLRAHAHGLMVPLGWTPAAVDRLVDAVFTKADLRDARQERQLRAAGAIRREYDPQIDQADRDIEAALKAGRP